MTGRPKKAESLCNPVEDVTFTTSEMTGIHLFGTIKDRKRRMVPKDNPTTEVINYAVSDDNNRMYYVDDFSPSSYYEVGEHVDIPVYITPYKRKSGDLTYKLNVLKSFSRISIGESF